MKKTAIVLGGFFLLVLGSLLVIPFVVDVNQYRPQIVTAVNEKMNGSFELGNLSLSLWGKIQIKIDGLMVRDVQKRTVISVKDASFELPYFSIFSGSPLITLKMIQPEIQVIKDKDGKMNLLDLMKPTVSAETTPATKQPADQKVELPGFAVNARVGILLEDAKVVYRDEARTLTNTIDRLNLRVKDFSLSRKTQFQLWAQLKTTMGQDLKVEGPLQFDVELTPEVSGGEFKSASVVASFIADDLSVRQGDVFFKNKGVPANFKFNGSLDQEKLKLNQATLKFHNAELVVTGEFLKNQGANFHFETKPVELKAWSDLIPMLKQYELEGRFSLKGDVKGPLDSLQYMANLNVNQLAMKGPYLKAKPVLDAEVMIATDRIEKFKVELNGPGNQLLLTGKMLSFSTPQLSFSLSSPKGMDLDQWIEFPKTGDPSSQRGSDQSGAASGVAADYDVMLEPLRKNEMAKKMSVDGTLSVSFLKAMNVRIEGIESKIQMKNLVAALGSLKMKMFEGLISGGFTVDLKPSKPQYTLNLNVSGFNMQKAVESQFQSFKDTIIGILSLNMQGAGSSFNASEIKKKLQLKGEFKISNAVFKSIDVARIANTAIGDSLTKIASKVPSLEGKKVNVPANKESKYELVSSQFQMSGGFLDAPNFLAKAAPKQGVDIKGSTKMGVVDQSLDAKWELIDTYRLTGADQVNVSLGGKTLNNVLAKSEKDPVVFPVSVGCKWSSPCPSYTSTVEYLAGVAAGRVSKAVGEEAKAKVKGVVEDTLKKAIGGGNPLKGIFGR